MIPTSLAIRKRILEMSFAGQSVHVPSAFSVVELVRVLHDKHLRYPNNDPEAAERDFFVLSKGHGVMALYPILESRGWIPESAVDGYFKDGSQLPGLSEASVPGCEVNSGSLGQGLSVAVGFAWSAKLNQSKQRTFCIVGDGEINEGPIWEALMFAGFHALNNLVVLVDKNGYQAMGKTKAILEIKDMGSVLRGFGFEVHTIDGHSEDLIDLTISSHRDGGSQKPLAVIAKTVKGKGVSFIENQNHWHYTRLNEDTFSEALKELKSKV
jgi:transketolase